MLLRIFEALRWVILVVLLLIAVQTLLPVVNRTQWYAVLVTTELGYVLALAALLLMLSSYYFAKRRAWFVAIASMVAVIGLSPSLSAGYHFPGCFKPVDVLDRIATSSATPGKKILYSESAQAALHYYFYPADISQEGRLAPVAILIHGGGWRSRQMGLGAWLIKRLNHLGYAVVAPEYSLAPKANYPQPLHDLDVLYQHISSNNLDLAVDPQNISLLGRSAGAHLASLWAFTRPDVPVKNVIGFYGVYDMVAAWQAAPEVSMHDGRKILSQFMGGGLDEMPARYVDASPRSHISDGIPPTLLLHGGRDDWVPHSQLQLMRALNHSNIDTVTLPWATHGFDAVPYSPGGIVAACQIERQLSGGLP